MQKRRTCSNLFRILSYGFPPSPVFLLANLTERFRFGALPSEELILQQFTQLFSCVITVQSLAAGLLHFHDQPTRHVSEMSTRGTLVYLLAAGPATSDERLLDIRLRQAAPVHPLFELCEFSFRNSEVNHIPCHRCLLR